MFYIFYIFFLFIYFYLFLFIFIYFCFYHSSKAQRKAERLKNKLLKENKRRKNNNGQEDATVAHVAVEDGGSNDEIKRSELENEEKRYTLKSYLNLYFYFILFLFHFIFFFFVLLICKYCSAKIL